MSPHLLMSSSSSQILSFKCCCKSIHCAQVERLSWEARAEERFATIFIVEFQLHQHIMRSAQAMAAVLLAAALLGFVLPSEAGRVLMTYGAPDTYTPSTPDTYTPPTPSPTYSPPTYTPESPPYSPSVPAPVYESPPVYQSPPTPTYSPDVPAYSPPPVYQSPPTTYSPPIYSPPVTSPPAGGY